MKSRHANADAGKMLRYILAILVVLICFAHPAAAQPNTAFVKNKGKVYTQAGEPLYLIRLAGKMTMPGYVHYALIDKQARVVSYSPRLNHFAHNKVLVVFKQG